MTGVALTAALSLAIFDEPITPVMAAGIALVMVGVLVVELGSQRVTYGVWSAPGVADSAEY